MRTALILVPALLASLLALGPAPCRAAESDTELAATWKASQAQWAQAMARLAERCHGARLYGVRDEIYLRLLYADPDHEVALKRLKYQRQKDGSWSPPARFKLSPNLSRAGLEQAGIDQAQLDADLGRAAEQAREQASPVLAAQILADLLHLAPMAESTRRINQEIPNSQDAGSWLLAETPPSRERRRLLTETAASAIASAEIPLEDRITTDEARMRVPFRTVLAGTALRLLGTVPLEELQQEARLAQAASVLFACATLAPAPPFRNLRLIVLDDGQWREPVLAGWPHSRPEDRSYVASLQSFWLPKSETLVIVTSEADRRVEWAARQPLQALLRRSHDIDAARGWAYEGIPLYLSWLLTGERQTYMVRREGYAEQRQEEQDALWERLKRPDTDWFAEAAQMLKSYDAASLRLLLGKTVTTMDGSDRLLAFALAAYLIEARPAEAMNWLGGLQEDGAQTEGALLVALGLTPDLLRHRLARWLGERDERGQSRLPGK